MLRERFDAVRRLRHEHSITTLCRVLKVNRSSYYKHFSSKKPSSRTIENQNIRTKILTLYASTDKRLGVKKMRRRLEVEYGIHISVGRVERFMKSMFLPKISTRIKPPRSKKTGANQDDKYENLLKRDFHTSAPNKAWVSDITYVRVGNGFNYVCTVMDLYSRKIIAWNAGRRADSLLVVQTLEQAWLKRGKPKSVLFHSDRGTQYTAKSVRQVMDRKNFLQSFSNAGQPHDNAVAEAFFRFLKEEELYRRKFSCTEELKSSLFSYIDGFYNTRRPHSANDELTPNEKEALFWSSKTK